jgi:hypothetical protein
VDQRLRHRVGVVDVAAERIGVRIARDVVLERVRRHEAAGVERAEQMGHEQADRQYQRRPEDGREELLEPRRHAAALPGGGQRDRGEQRP